MPENEQQIAEAIRELASQVDYLGNAVQSAADTIAKAIHDAAQESDDD